MALKRHHKIIIGSLSSLVILFMITSSIFTYLIFIKQTASDKELDKKITSLQTDTQAKFNELSDNLLTTKNDLKSLGLQIGSIDAQITKLKASVSSDFSGVIGDVIESVVIIKTNNAQASGFILTNDGYVVTNVHVIAGATAAGIITYDGELHSVKLIGSDSTMDIALLKIEGNYKSLGLGNSNNVIQGEAVVAIGSPYGLDFSVTQGIISNIHQEGENGIKGYIQIDAALNPGSSGGPLINKEGKVIGINNFKIGGAEGLGFALESNYLKSTVNSISQKVYGKDLI